MTPDEPERARGPFIGASDHAVHGKTQLVPVTRRTNGRGAICTDCGLVLEEDLTVQDAPDGPPTIGWACRDCDNVFALEVAPKRAREMVTATSPPAFAMVVATRPVRYRDGTLATIPVVDVDADEVDGDDENGDRVLIADGGSNSHAGSVLAQLKQADRDGDLPDEMRDSLDEETRAALEEDDSERECEVCGEPKPDVEERCLEPIGYTTTLVCDFCAAYYGEVETGAEPIAYTRDNEASASPLFCPACEPSSEDGPLSGQETEPLTAEDLSDFADASCASCDRVLLMNGVPVNAFEATADADGCIACGAEETLGYVELEFRLAGSDAFVSGDLCEEAAERLAYKLFDTRDGELDLTGEVIRAKMDDSETAQGGDDGD